MELTLNARKREIIGKRSRRLRALGKLPAIVYGHHAETTPLELDRHEFQRVFSRAGRNHLLDLIVDGGRPNKVLVREIQTHPRRQGPVHVDLYQVSLAEKLHADVPVLLTGESPAVKLGDGDILQTLQTIRVECLPANIPERYELDISTLEEVDAAIRVADLPAIPDVTILLDPEEMIVKVAPRRVVVEEEPVAAEGEEEAAAEAGAEGEGAPAAEGSQESEES
jgi:large subunit ribosomal protein L25